MKTAFVAAPYHTRAWKGSQRTLRPAAGGSAAMPLARSLLLVSHRHGAELQLPARCARVPAGHALRVAFAAVLLQLIRRAERREAALAFGLLAQEMLRPAKHGTYTIQLGCGCDDPKP